MWVPGCQYVYYYSHQYRDGSLLSIASMLWRPDQLDDIVGGYFRWEATFYKPFTRQNGRIISINFFWRQIEKFSPRSSSYPANIEPFQRSVWIRFNKNQNWFSLTTLMTEFILGCHILAPRYLLVRIKIATREASSQQTLGLKETTILTRLVNYLNLCHYLPEMACMCVSIHIQCACVAETL